MISSIPPWDIHRFVEDFDPALTAVTDAAPASDFGVYLHSIALNEKNMKLDYPDQYSRVQINQMCSGYTESIARCCRGIKAGKMPLLDTGACGEGFYGNVICSRILDSTRAPEGKGTLYLYHMVPLKPEGNFDQWDSLKPFGEALIKRAQQFITNLDDSDILGIHSETPRI